MAFSMGKFNIKTETKHWKKVVVNYYFLIKTRVKIYFNFWRFFNKNRSCGSSSLKFKQE